MSRGGNPEEIWGLGRMAGHFIKLRLSRKISAGCWVVCRVAWMLDVICVRRFWVLQTDAPQPVGVSC